ncbi:hypothetical protein SAMN05446935_5348 [Burkholderia sp. YR290]|jgi:hypothetical protein|nr:hypothetical protein SAMN05446934_4271 [Paraburkholderia hospita]SOE84892.1 hypothetical protein SAMN05446935_5348 [Burkholderia sp. YR290]
MVFAMRWLASKDAVWRNQIGGPYRPARSAPVLSVEGRASKNSALGAKPEDQSEQKCTIAYVGIFTAPSY